MRLVEWTEFRTLPEGTLFQEILADTLGDLGPIQVLGGFRNEDTKYPDYISASLMPVANFTSVLGRDWQARVGLKETAMVAFTPSGFGGDGTYAHEGRRWLVWDREDRERLAGWLLDPAKAVAEQNDDPHVWLKLP